MCHFAPDTFVFRFHMKYFPDSDSPEFAGQTISVVVEVKCDAA
jgi:hypothetical protein